MKRIDFYFDFISPYSYLAVKNMGALLARSDVEIQWIAVNLPKLIKLSGNVPPANIKNKALYSLRDLKRWAAYLDVPFQMIMPGSYDSRPALRLACGLKAEAQKTFIFSAFDAIWSGQVDTQSKSWLADILALYHLPLDWLQIDQNDLDNNTRQALKAGAFGVPTFVLHGVGRAQMFFGVDHMDFLERAIAGQPQT